MYEPLPQKILVIEPHPDDLILMCGGLAAKVSTNGGHVYAVTITGGGGAAAGKEQDGAMTLERKTESEEADEILGVEKREWLGYETRDAFGSKSKELYETLMGKVRHYNPDIVITTYDDKENGVHPLHMWCREYVPPALYQAGENIRREDFGEPVYPSLWVGENPRKKLLPLSTPKIYVNISGVWIQYKVMALDKQKSQKEILGKDISAKVKSLAAMRADEVLENIEYAEAFEEIAVYPRAVY